MPEEKKLQKYLFDIVVLDKKSRIVRKFVMFATSAEDVTAAFSMLDTEERAEGEPLIPEGGSFSVDIVEFDHPSGITEI
jgi:hypothetical protein